MDKDMPLSKVLLQVGQEVETIGYKIAISSSFG
jgi:hypothetical protein